MDLAQALEKARLMVNERNWGPADFKQAAAFTADEQTKNFIELEGGGKDVLSAILKEGYYNAYTWHVRHFKQYDANETSIYFTPDGKPYGFIQTLAEEIPGPALTEQEARQKIEIAAHTQWNTDFSAYKLAEHAQETKPNGRVDHTFVYENMHKKVGAAPYQLKLKLSGDIFTEHTLSIKVPESFKRNYENMRSSNDTLAGLASIFSIILYGLLGCIIGLFILMRKRAVLWFPAFVCSFIIALFLALTRISELPHTWMYYDTAIGTSTIYLEIIISLLRNLATTTLLYGIVFATAEGLTRLAFGNHIQLWRSWTTQAASSVQIVGRTIGGYLIIGFYLAFVTATYYFASKYLGWWSPSSTLFDPNILATYAPWIGAIGQSLAAGFMEECLFRAVPLAGAALLGKKWNRPRLFLTIGFIVQVCLFSAAHANYPAQPFYARFLELIIPSCIFGGIYLLFGLLPSIISHVVYDIVWFALPIFLASSKIMLTNQLLVIICALVPLLIVIYALLRNKKWHSLEQFFYNYTYQASHPVSHKESIIEKSIIITKKPQYSLFGCIGAIGLLLWLWFTPFKHDALSTNLTAAQAYKKAQEIVQLPKTEWQSFTHIYSNLGASDRFIWREQQHLYQTLLKDYIAPAQWIIRFAQFGKDLVRNEEEYTVYLDPDGTVNRITHQLPESQEGATLTEQEARIIAQQLLQSHYKLKPAEVEEISAISRKKPHRLDWAFTFKDNTAYPTQNKNNDGQARIDIHISGNKIHDHYRHIFMPEKWQRQDRDDQTVLDLLTSLCKFILSSLSIILCLYAVRAWIHHQFPTRLFFFFLLLLIGKSSIQIINLLPTYTATFKTSEPFINQLVILLLYIALLSFGSGLFYAIPAAYLAKIKFYYQAKSTFGRRLLTGICTGILYAGFYAFCVYYAPHRMPLWPDYASAHAHLSFLSVALILLTKYISNVVVFYGIFKAFDLCTNLYAQKGMLLALTSSILFGIALHGAIGITHITSWLIIGCALGILLYALYLLAIRFDRSVIPIFTATIILLEASQQACFNAFPGAVMGAILTFIILAALSTWWSNKLYREACVKID